MSRNAFESVANGSNDGGDGGLDLPEGGFEGTGVLLGVSVEIRHHNSGVDREIPNESETLQLHVTPLNLNLKKGGK